MTSSATDISQTPRFKSASMSVIQGQAPSLAGAFLSMFLLALAYTVLVGVSDVTVVLLFILTALLSAERSPLELFSCFMLHDSETESNRD